MIILLSSPFIGEKKTILPKFWVWRLAQYESKVEEGIIQRIRDIYTQNFWRIIDLKEIHLKSASKVYNTALRLGVEDGITRHLKGDLKEYKKVRKARGG